MKRLWFLVAALFLLAACGGTANETVSDSAEEVATQLPAATEATAEPTEADEADMEEDSAETADVAMPPADVDLTAAIQPETDPAVAGVIRDRDWTKGADDPLVTIIEYGDFQ